MGTTEQDFGEKIQVMMAIQQARSYADVMDVVKLWDIGLIEHTMKAVQSVIIDRDMNPDKVRAARSLQTLLTALLDLKKVVDEHYTVDAMKFGGWPNG